MTTPQLKPKEKVWLDHYQQCLKDGASITGYAKETGINVSSFHAAVTRLKTKGIISANNTKQPFVKVIPPPPQLTPSIKITLPSGTLLELGNTPLNDQCIQFIQTLDQSLRGNS